MKVIISLLAGCLLFGCGAAENPEPVRTVAAPAYPDEPPVRDDRIAGTVIDPQSSDLRLFWKDGAGKRYGSLDKLRKGLAARGDSLVFATNGGMYQPDHSPVGLYVENGKLLSPLDTASGKPGNFYLQPNGVFLLNQAGIPSIVPSDAFVMMPAIKFATQSGPLLLFARRMHPALREGSTNVNIRSGVGLLPDRRLLFAISREQINFYDFADYFRRNGCTDALYLDGFVSRTYAPEQGLKDTGGDFGVMIGVVEKGKR